MIATDLYITFKSTGITLERQSQLRKRLFCPTRVYACQREGAGFLNTFNGDAGSERTDEKQTHMQTKTQTLKGESDIKVSQHEETHGIKVADSHGERGGKKKKPCSLRREEIEEKGGGRRQKWGGGGRVMSGWE